MDEEYPGAVVSNLAEDTSKKVKRREHVAHFFAPEKGESIVSFRPRLRHFRPCVKTRELGVETGSEPVNYGLKRALTFELMKNCWVKLDFNVTHLGSRDQTAS
jgi:hypothetical protein